MLVDVDPTKILLVEDDPHDAELVQLALASSNLVNHLDIVADGEAALHYLLGQDGQSPRYPLPRLVLLDLKLPKVNGIRVLEAIRADPRTYTLVVVIMTSSQADNDLARCYDLGVNSYIVKPLDFEQFTNVARQVGLYWMLLNQPPPLASH